MAVVGGGFAGAMVAARLLALAGPPLRISLFERRPPPGRGVAYGTASPLHVMNVPASNMSAFAERPDDFVGWLAARGEPTAPPAFVRRGLYGLYVGETLARAVEAATGRHAFELVGEEAVGLLPEAGGYALRLASGERRLADRVVLALGNMPPAPPAALGSEVLARPWFVADPWSPAALAPLPPGAEVLLLGTGLTAVDLALSLVEEAGAAHVLLVSRRAMLPLPWRAVPAWADWLDPDAAPTRPSELLAMLRAEVGRAEAAGSDWRAVFDALRPHTQALWRRLPLVERRRFLRHARSFWEAHRHRMPPQVAERLAQHRAAGRIAVRAARLRGLTAIADDTGAVARLLARDGRAEERMVARAVLCTGPEVNYRRVRHPLVLDLIGTGLARPEALYLGLDVDPQGRPYDEDGRITPGIWTIGSLRKGALWESTAVPELRVQAAEVAAAVVASL